MIGNGLPWTPAEIAAAQALVSRPGPMASVQPPMVPAPGATEAPMTPAAPVVPPPVDPALLAGPQGPAGATQDGVVDSAVARLAQMNGMSPAQARAHMEHVSRANGQTPAQWASEAQREMDAREGFVGPQRPANDTTQPPPPAAPAQQPPQPQAARPAGGGGSPFGKLQADVTSGQQAQLAAGQKQQAAVGREADATEFANQAKASFMFGEAERQAKENADRQREYQEINARHAEYQQQTQAMLDDIAAQRYDQGRLFNSGNTATDMAFGLGAVLAGTLGGIAAGINGGPNQGTAAVNQIIERDMRAWELNQANKKDAVAGRNTLYGQMRAQFNDKRMADDAFRLAGTEVAKQRLAAMTSQLESPIMRARAEKLMAELEGQTAQLQTSFSEKALAQAKAEAAARAAAAASAENAAWKRTMEEREQLRKEKETDATVAEKRANAGKESGELWVPTGDGSGYYARSKTEAQQDRESREASLALLSLVKQARAARAASNPISRWDAQRATSDNPKLGDGWFSSDETKRLNSLGNEMGVLWAKAHKMGTWDKGTESAVKQIIGNPGAVWGSGSDALLARLENETQAALARAAVVQTTGGSTASAPPGFTERKK